MTVTDSLRWVARRSGVYEPLRSARDVARRSLKQIDAVRRRHAKREAEAFLRVIIDPAECIDRFDATYLDDFPHILRENFGLTEANFAGSFIERRFSDMWRTFTQRDGTLSIAGVCAFIREVGVDPAQFAPPVAPRKANKQNNLHLVSTFDEAEKRRFTSEADLDFLKQFQVQISLVSGGEAQQDWEHFPTRWTTEGREPWSDFIKGLLSSGALHADSAALDIGPRYLSEIRYFREELGLRQTIGLDLFTKDEALIKVADMHAMPFPDNSFDLIFTRATHDKAYDIRKAIAEQVRVTRPGGIIISDDGVNYVDGVSPLARTDLKSTGGLLKLFGSAVGRILYRKDLLSRNYFTRRQALLAIEIRK
ncbi:MAG TPA: class I SAM-dependent methyltransferase [Vicinamibacterales bacterium]|nr:class I SAM-dependent methyltransferase [Vicinamibacterales bacterium]